MQPVNIRQDIPHTYARGWMSFSSNHIDQSDSFLQHVVIALLKQRSQRLIFTDTTVDQMTFDTAYVFEDWTHTTLCKTFTDNDLFNKLINQSPSIKKVHPKEQFAQLQIQFQGVVEHNEQTEQLQTTHLTIELTYDPEHDTLGVKTLHEQETPMAYEAVYINCFSGVDAMDSFTPFGTHMMYNALSDYVKSHQERSTPLISSIRHHFDTHPELDPALEILAWYNETGLPPIVRCDITSYLDDQFEEHIVLSPTVQQLFHDVIEDEA